MRRIFSPTQSVYLRHFLHFSRSPSALFALFVFTILLLMAFGAQWIAPQDPYDLSQLNIIDGFSLPGTLAFDESYYYIFGTDDQGRDFFSAILFGLRTSLLIGFTAAFVAAIIGTLVGLLAGYYGGTLDNFLMRIVDLVLSLPTILIALLILAFFGKGIVNVMLTIIFIEWAYYARTVRAQTLVEARKEYIQAAKGLVVPTARILFRHILPNCLSAIFVIAALQLARAITLESTLSFLGLGVPVEQPSLGSLIAKGVGYIQLYSYMTFVPGIALLLLIVSINMVGDRLREIFNPRGRYER